MNRSFLTPHRWLVLIAALLLVSSFLPLDQGPHRAEQPQRLGSRIVHRPRALVAAAISPVTGLLHPVTTGLREQDSQRVIWDDWEDIGARYGSALQRLHALERENAELKQKIMQLTQIRELFGLSGVSLLDARVKSVSLDPLNPVLTLNRGSNNGVREHMAVASGWNLVGEVVHVGPLTSDVRLITAKGSRLRVQIAPPTADAAARTLEVQLERSDDGPWFEVRTTQQQPVAPGDVAQLTDPLWPAEATGFFVGQVTEVAPDPDDPLNFQRAIIKPIPSLTTLGRATILVPTD